MMRQHKGQAVPHEQKVEDQRLLHPRDEAELVEYIRGLTERHLMPTRQMIINFATPFCGWEPSDSWVTRLLHRHSDTLLTAWSTPMESVRHQADSGEKYKQYFDLLHRKMAEHKVLPENTYNMDEKGFIIGVISRAKRCFDRVLYKKKQNKQSQHDGNREWVTVLATICGDGSTLPQASSFQQPVLQCRQVGYTISIQKSTQFTSQRHQMDGQTTIWG